MLRHLVSWSTRGSREAVVKVAPTLKCSGAASVSLVPPYPANPPGPRRRVVDGTFRREREWRSCPCRSRGSGLRVRLRREHPAARYRNRRTCGLRTRRASPPRWSSKCSKYAANSRGRSGESSATSRLFSKFGPPTGLVFIGRPEQARYPAEGDEQVLDRVPETITLAVGVRFVDIPKAYERELALALGFSLKVSE